MGEQQSLDLGGKDVEAGHVHELLRPARDGHVAEMIDRRHIAGAEPVAVERLGGLLRAAVVAAHGPAPVERNFADFTTRQFTIVRAKDAAFEARQRGAAR